MGSLARQSGSSHTHEFAERHTSLLPLKIKSYTDVVPARPEAVIFCANAKRPLNDTVRPPTLSCVTIIDTLSPTLRDDSESEVATKVTFWPNGDI